MENEIKSMRLSHRTSDTPALGHIKPGKLEQKSIESVQSHRELRVDIKIRMATTGRRGEVTRHPMDVIPQYDCLNITLDGLTPKPRLAMAA